MNKNCSSCVILGHHTIFHIYERYNVIIEDNNNGDFPKLMINNGTFITGLELYREICNGDINKLSLSDEQLEKMFVNNHTNCLHNPI